MTVRPEVQQLLDLGPFPVFDEAEEQDIRKRGEIIASIVPPVNRDEASALLQCFGPDDAFGLAWALLHLVETTPGGVPLPTRPNVTENEWVCLLWDRSQP